MTLPLDPSPVKGTNLLKYFVPQILEAIGVDFIDESEVLTPADAFHHVEKHPFTVPFVCGCRNLGEALRRISEGAAMIRTKGEAGTGDVIEAVRHMRAVNAEISKAKALNVMELRVMAKEIGAPYDLLKETAELGRLRTYFRVPNRCFGAVFWRYRRGLLVVCLTDMSCSLTHQEWKC